MHGACATGSFNGAQPCIVVAYFVAFFTKILVAANGIRGSEFKQCACMGLECLLVKLDLSSHGNSLRSRIKNMKLCFAKFNATPKPQKSSDMLRVKSCKMH